MYLNKTSVCQTHTKYVNGFLIETMQAVFCSDYQGVTKWREQTDFYFVFTNSAPNKINLKQR